MFGGLDRTTIRRNTYTGVHGRARGNNPFQIKRKNGGGGESRTQRRKQIDIKREKAKRRGNSFEFPGRRIFRVLNYATSRFSDCRKASRDRSSGRARIKFIFRSVCPNLDNVSLLSVAQ